MTRRDSLQLFLLPPGPCPYLPGRIEQKACTVLDKTLAPLASLLLERGFRRSQNMFYRQRCPGCRACQSARIRLKDFKLSDSFRRVLKKNADLSYSIEPAKATMVLYELFADYLHSRHSDGGMTDMAYGDFTAMMEEFPDDTRFMVFRQGEAVKGVMLVDETPDGTSAVYSFFDPTEEKRSLGTWMILKLAEYTLSVGKPHLYLGFWVKGSPKMAYKAKYQPLELFVGERWVEFNEADK